MSIAVASLLWGAAQNAAAQTMIDMPAPPAVVAAPPADGDETAATQPGANEAAGERTYTVGEIALTRYARARTAPRMTYGSRFGWPVWRRSWPPHSWHPWVPAGYHMRGHYPFWGVFPNWYGGGGWGWRGFSGVSFRSGW